MGQEEYIEQILARSRELDERQLVTTNDLLALLLAREPERGSERYQKWLHCVADLVSHIPPGWTPKQRHLVATVGGEVVSIRRIAESRLAATEGT